MDSVGGGLFLGALLHRRRPNSSRRPALGVGRALGVLFVASGIGPLMPVKCNNPWKCLWAAMGSALIFAAGCTTQHSYPGPTHGLTFNGTVQSLDLKNQSLTLLPLKPGEPVVFAWNRNTKFWKNGIPIRPEEVEPGRSVRLHFHPATGTEIHFAASECVAHRVYVEAPYAPLY